MGLEANVEGRRERTNMYSFQVTTTKRLNNKTNNSLRQNTTILYNYWYFVMATRFGLSSDHLQASVLK
jgi:hypothetical protein